MMRKSIAWLAHAGGGLVTTGFGLALIHKFVPVPDQPMAVAGLAWVGYIVGVRMPTPR